MDMKTSIHPEQLIFKHHKVYVAGIIGRPSEIEATGGEWLHSGRCQAINEVNCKAPGRAEAELSNELFPNDVKFQESTLAVSEWGAQNWSKAGQASVTAVRSRASCILSFGVGNLSLTDLLSINDCKILPGQVSCQTR